MEMAGNLSIVLSDKEKHPFAITQQQQWNIHYSHFFRFPPNNNNNHLLSSSSSILKPIPEHRLRNGGTWLAAASTATLQITSDVFNPQTSILIVSLQGNIIEEHYMSSMQFSLLQVSCVTEYPTKGSRAVIASYKDTNGQIQKFALQFETSSHAETFIKSLKLEGISKLTKLPQRLSPSEVSEEPTLDTIKKFVPKKRKRKDLKSNLKEVWAIGKNLKSNGKEGSLKDAMDTSIPSSCFTSEISSESEFVSSNRLQCREEPVATSSPRVASILNNSSKKQECSQESVLGNNIQSTSEVDMPPSFTALLNNCSGEVEQEQVYVPVMESEEENGLRSQIMRCMSDPSFYDILAKVDEAITEMGGFLEL